MKKELSIFEQMGGTYTEVDGIFYPNLVVKPENNVMVGKYGCVLWKKSIRCDVWNFIWMENCE